MVILFEWGDIEAIFFFLLFHRHQILHHKSFGDFENFFFSFFSFFAHQLLS